MMAGNVHSFVQIETVGAKARWAGAGIKMKLIAVGFPRAFNEPIKELAGVALAPR